MSGATRLHKQHGFRVAAALIGLWLVLGGVLALRHDSRVAHTRDARGRSVHAAALGGHHDRSNSAPDVHGQRDRDADTSECALSDVVHHAALAACTRVSIAAAPRIEAAACGGRAEHRWSCTVYRQAPKTSPPAA